MPVVSIVLPSYNGETYIRESIESIREQTFQDWELIIIDDCSNDRTLEIALEYERVDGRINVIHNKINRGLPSSLNVGFTYAEGQYLTWTSDDNQYLPNALDVMVSRMQILDTAMVCADAYMMDEAGRIKLQPILQYKDEELWIHNSVGACFLYRRELKDTIGEYDENLYGVEDYDYWIRIKEKYGKIERIDQVLYKYRYHDASLSITKWKQIRLALARLRKKHWSYILDEYKEKNERELLASCYYEMIENQTIDLDIRERIQLLLPELKNDMPGDRGKYIVFGAGVYGKEALKILDKAVVYFADNNSDKVGKYEQGREILSFERMVLLAGRYDIMIAIHRNHIYELLHQLEESGISKYCTLQTYIEKYHLDIIL